MTPKQIILYGKRWGAVCQANDWRMERGRLGGVRSAECGVRSELHTEIITLAQEHAQSQHHAITPDDLRRACIAKITGKFQSAKDLTNPQFDRLLTLFRILINPEDIDALIDWDHPEHDARKRLLWSIKHHAAKACGGSGFPEAYVMEICKQMFGLSISWELDLTEVQLKNLSNLIRARAESRGARPSRSPSCASRATAERTSNEPF